MLGKKQMWAIFLFEFKMSLKAAETTHNINNAFGLLLPLLKSLQSCPTLCSPIDSSPPGSPVPGILQTRTLEWVAISFSKAWKWKVKSEREVAQSCPTLSDPMDCSLPGSSVHGIFQARVLEWSAITFSWPAQSLQSRPTLCDPHRRQATSLPRPWDSPGKNTGVGCHFLLQCMKVKSESEVAQSCPTLSDPMDCSLPGSSIHGIFQARVLEWSVIAFSWPRNC